MSENCSTRRGMCSVQPPNGGGHKAERADRLTGHSQCTTSCVARVDFITHSDAATRQREWATFARQIALADRYRAMLGASLRKTPRPMGRDPAYLTVEILSRWNPGGTPDPRKV